MYDQIAAVDFAVGSGQIGSGGLCIYIGGLCIYIGINIRPSPQDFRPKRRKFSGRNGQL